MRALGIDFGTSTTVAALHGSDSPVLLQDESGKDVLPSVVAFLPTGRVAVGRAAQARRIIDPANTVYSMKRILGKSWSSREVADFATRYPFVIERSSSGGAEFVTRAGNITPTQVAGHVITRVRQLSPLAGGDVAHVTVTVPTSFGEREKRATLEAVQWAGFDDVDIILEPQAAALAYAMNEPGERTVAVYDLGGGTFDLAVLRCQGPDCSLLAAGGDPYLGGDDIDLRCANWVADQVLEAHHWDVRSSTTAFQTLVFACERAKIRLSELDQTALPLGQVDTVLEGKDIVLERAQLARLFVDLLQRTFVICDDVMAKSGLDPYAVDAVILAGGSANIPAIKSGVEAYFGHTPLFTLPPDKVVALGAAAHASQLA